MQNEANRISRNPMGIHGVFFLGESWHIMVVHHLGASFLGTKKSKKHQKNPRNCSHKHYVITLRKSNHEFGISYVLIDQSEPKPFCGQLRLLTTIQVGQPFVLLKNCHVLLVNPPSHGFPSSRRASNLATMASWCHDRSWTRRVNVRAILGGYSVWLVVEVYPSEK